MNSNEIPDMLGIELNAFEVPSDTDSLVHFL